MPALAGLVFHDAAVFMCIEGLIFVLEKGGFKMTRSKFRSFIDRDKMKMVDARGGETTPRNSYKRSGLFGQPRLIGLIRWCERRSA